MHITAIICSNHIFHQSITKLSQHWNHVVALLIVFRGKVSNGLLQCDCDCVLIVVDVLEASFLHVAVVDEGEHAGCL